MSVFKENAADPFRGRKNIVTEGGGQSGTAGPTPLLVTMPLQIKSVAGGEPGEAV